MSKSRTLAVLLGAAAMTLTPLSPTAAVAAVDPPATPTYQGNIYEGTASTCEQTTDVSGRYSITIKKDGTASVSLTMFMDGKLHAAWGGNAWGERFTWVETGTGYVLSSLRDWTMTIDGGTMRFVIPGRYPGCDAAAYVLATVR